MAAPGRRSTRQFHCSDALWDTFRRMAADQEKGVDELINDALESYAQLAGYQTGIDAEPPFAGVGDDGPATPPPAHAPQRRGGLPPPPPPLPMPMPMPGGARAARGGPPSSGGLGGMFQPGPTPIKDGNISRKHAAVVRRNGTYFIKDLGSTNGIDFKGMRIDNKRIDEGDVFHLCDYELRFTYKR
jgi:hypothetical protein